jgi:hypothetical protein
VRFEVLMSVIFKIMIFKVVTLCSLVDDKYQFLDLRTA